MESTNASIDRIRRARKSGADMMAEADRVPWTLDPHHTVTTPNAPGATDVPVEKANSPRWPANEPDQRLAEAAWWGSADPARGEENLTRQHGFLTDVADGVHGVDNRRSLEEDGLTDPLEQDAQYRDQSGLSQQDWQGTGGGMSGQERMAAMAEQQVAGDQAKFDENARVERRRNAVREQSNREFAEWEASKPERMAQAERDRAAIHEERRAKQAQQNASDSEAAFETKLSGDLTPPVAAPADGFDPADKKSADADHKRMVEEETADTLALDALPSEATPMEAPLPGEETLPPAVAGWAQRRAERGQGGTNALRAAYHKEVPEDARSGGISFENWLVQKGIKPDMPVQEAIPILNRLVPMDAQHTERRRDQYVNTMMKRHAEYLVKNGITRQQLYDAYDGGSRDDKTGDPILSGSRAANRTIVNGMKDQRDQQIAINVRKNADQVNRGRSFGVPTGAVKFFDSLQEAKTPQERANILMLAHRSQPHMGWDKMAAMLMKGEIDNDAMSQWAGRFGSAQEQPKPMDRIAENAEAITSNFGNPGWEDQARSHSMSVRGQGAKPPETEADIKQFAVNGTRRVLMAGGSLTPEQKVAAQRSFDGSSLSAFANQLGLKPDDERLPKMYYAIFDKAPPMSWFGAPGRAIAAGGNAVSNGIRSLIGSFGIPMAPSAWAAAPPSSSLGGPDPFK